MLTPEQNQRALGVLRALVPNSRITTSIQQNECVMLTGQDVCNIRNRELARMLNGRSLISALLDSLGDDAYHFSQVDSEQKLTHLGSLPHALPGCSAFGGNC